MSGLPSAPGSSTSRLGSAIPALGSASCELGALLWSPTPERVKASALQRYRDWLARERGLQFADYASLWRWSTLDLEGFWGSVWDYFELGPRRGRVLDGRDMPGARWFPSEVVNYAERLLRAPATGGDGAVVIACTEDGGRVEYTHAQLCDAVARVQRGLRRLGVAAGDRVVAYAGNTVEALVCLLACASLGAVWASCPPEFGSASVLDRFQQIEPKVLIAASSYRYNGKLFDRRAAVTELRAALPTLSAVVMLDSGAASDQETVAAGSSVHGWSEFTAQTGPLEFAPVPFAHPLWILFSSGTTGLPKALVHGHGGMLLEHLKVLSLHGDLGPSDRFFWFSTTGWMMWNYLVSGLAVGATLVLYDGSPGHPDLRQLWRLAEQERVSYFGTSAPWIQACLNQGMKPGLEFDLSALKAIGSTGSPLSPEGFAWVYEAVARDVHLQSVSGGTDLCTAFLAGCPELPVHAGELQCRALGAKVAVYGPTGEPVVGVVGELVIEAPMPCMPIGFWNDPDGARYRSSYFEDFPGVWRHGDWLTITSRGSGIISGRSDATLNRGGVRMGTSEFYRVVEALPGIVDSLVIDTSAAGVGGELWLFVVLAPGAALDQLLQDRIKSELRSKLSPRHVPDRMLPLSGVPRTLSGKKLEVPVKRMLGGTPLHVVVNPGTLRNPETLSEILELYTSASKTP
jgi:acetoacetyl-CoA synthetase